MEFRMVAPIMPTGPPIRATLTLLRRMSLKSSLPSLGRVPRLLAPLRKVRQLDPSCHLDGRHTRKELRPIVCPMMLKRMSRCSLLLPRQQRQKYIRSAIAARVWYQNSTSTFTGKTWAIVQVGMVNRVCGLATQIIIQGVNLRTRLVCPSKRMSRLSNIHSCRQKAPQVHHPNKLLLYHDHSKL